jgi:hypothetical protein
MSKAIAAVCLGLALATAAGPASARVQAGPHAGNAASAGYQGEAPPWSFACMKDHGPTQCGEPMWIYGN